MLYVNPLESGVYRYNDAHERAQQREEVALREFERLFLYQLLSEMRKTIPKSGLFPETPQRRVFNEMLDDVMAGEMAASGQFGIAQQIAQQIHSVDDAEKHGANAAGLLKPQAMRADIQGDASARLTRKEYEA